MNTNGRSSFDTISAIARMAGISRETLRDAIHRGELHTATLASGTVIVSLLEVRKWARRTRKRGRKPKKRADSKAGTP